MTESFTEPKFDAKKCHQHSETNNLLGTCCKRTLEQNSWKQIDYEKPSNTKQTNRIQNTRIEL